jgi:hypothetical protein
MQKRKGMEWNRREPSTVHGLLTWPDMQNSFVPWLFLRPNEANQLEPLKYIIW